MGEKKQRLQNLIHFSLSIRESFHSSMQRISEQKTEHLSLMASISAAVLAITAAFSSEKDLWINISFWMLFITVFVGTILVLLIIHIREETTLSERELATSALDKLKVSTRNAINIGSEYDDQHRRDFEREIERIKNFPNKYEGATVWLNFLYWLVLGSFVFGMLCLAAYWLEKGGVIIYMNLIIFAVIILASILLGYTWYQSIIQDETKSGKEKLLKNSSSQRKFKDFWAYFINFIIGGSVGYYLVSVRWGYVKSGDPLNFGDFFLVLLFVVSMFGHLPVLSLNITKGVEAIISRVLERK